MALGSALWPLAAHSLSLLVADFAYRGLGARPPLTEVSEPGVLLSIVAAAVLYLVAYNLLLALDVWLAGCNVLTFFVENRRVLLSVQVLPLPLAPVMAIALSSLGLPAYMVLTLALLAIAIAVESLVVAQRSLRKQVRHLSSYSSVGRAVRTSLELNELLGGWRWSDFYVTSDDPNTQNPEDGERILCLSAEQVTTEEIERLNLTEDFIIN